MQFCDQYFKGINFRIRFFKEYCGTLTVKIKTKQEKSFF